MVSSDENKGPNLSVLTAVPTGGVLGGWLAVSQSPQSPRLPLSPPLSLSACPRPTPHHFFLRPGIPSSQKQQATHKLHSPLCFLVPRGFTVASALKEDVHGRNSVSGFQIEKQCSGNGSHPNRVTVPIRVRFGLGENNHLSSQPTPLYSQPLTKAPSKVKGE